MGQVGVTSVSVVRDLDAGDEPDEPSVPHAFSSRIEFTCPHCGASVVVENPANPINFDATCGQCRRRLKVRPPPD